jgi:hypothetical protein
MRFAQRSDGFAPTSQQQVEILIPTHGDVGIQLSEMISKYAIKVVALAMTGAALVVVFEEEDV